MNCSEISSSWALAQGLMAKASPFKKSNYNWSEVFKYLLGFSLLCLNSHHLKVTWFVLRFCSLLLVMGTLKWYTLTKMYVSLLDEWSWSWSIHGPNSLTASLVQLVRKRLWCFGVAVLHLGIRKVYKISLLLQTNWYGVNVGRSARMNNLETTCKQHSKRKIEIVFIFFVSTCRVTFWLR